MATHQACVAMGAGGFHRDVVPGAVRLDQPAASPAGQWNAGSPDLDRADDVLACESGGRQRRGATTCEAWSRALRCAGLLGCLPVERGAERTCAGEHGRDRIDGEEAGAADLLHRVLLYRGVGAAPA